MLSFAPPPSLDAAMILELVALLQAGHTRWVCGEPKPRMPMFNPLGEDSEWPKAEMAIFLGIFFAPQWMTLPLGRIKRMLGL